MQVITLIHEEDGVFGVSFPDFPGCTTVAGSLDEAVAKAAQVLAFHADGMHADGIELPHARTLSELQADKEFRADAPARWSWRCPYAPPGRAVRVNMTFDESLLERVDNAAKRAGETRSGFFAAAAQKRLHNEFTR
ncbi:MAG: HicB family protein [Xanthobacteraceae bacterium]|nr:MAG: HicB family protein [Xanthobacteraceae bacterium]